MMQGMNSDLYRMGLELAERGRHQEAFTCIEQYLRTAPEDAEALNDAGAILHCLGRSEEAISYLSKAHGLRGDSGEILWNLSEACLAAGRADRVNELIEPMERLGVLHADILNRTADVFLNQGDKANAIETLLRSLQVSPEQAVLEPMIRVIRSKRPKIAFFCGGDGMTFLNEIIGFARDRFEVRVFEGTTESEMYELMTWSDISWFEWCTNLAVSASNMPRTCWNIVRLHRYEAYEKWPVRVNWSNIDFLVTVGNRVTDDTLRARVPGLEEMTSLVRIPNGVDIEKFTFSDRGRGKNIAFLGNLRMVKNPAFALQCMQKLHYIDPGYRLFFGGAIQDQVLDQYLKHMTAALGLNDVVFFDGWQEDVNCWLQDKHYIMSTSICEGHPVGILEGMACGLKPVVHNFLGAEYVLPAEFLFNISEEFCEQILSDSYQPMRYRSFVANECSMKKHLGAVNDIFVRLETEMDAQSLRSESYSQFLPAGAAQVFGN